MSGNARRGNDSYTRGGKSVSSFRISTAWQRFKKNQILRNVRRSQNSWEERGRVFFFEVPVLTHVSENKDPVFPAELTRMRRPYITRGNSDKIRKIIWKPEGMSGTLQSMSHLCPSVVFQACLPSRIYFARHLKASTSNEHETRRRVVRFRKELDEVQSLPILLVFQCLRDSEGISRTPKTANGIEMQLASHQFLQFPSHRHYRINRDERKRK